MKKKRDGVYLFEKSRLISKEDIGALYAAGAVEQQEIENAYTRTMSYPIMEAHNVSGSMENLQLRFDAMVGQDMTYMGVLQTAIASGIGEFPIPFILSNCHNALCALGGTLNADDHVFGMGAAKKYGAVYIPPNVAIMHQYMRESYAGCGTMILGADSHTRYGALGTLAMGEGAGELVKQLLNKTYDLPRPETVLIYMTGTPQKGVGPHDVILDIIRNVFKDGFVKNKIMEFTGPGVSALSMDFRNGMDTMSTESSCVSTIWETDEKVQDWLALHGRGAAYKKVEPGRLAYYDNLLEVDLSQVKPMIALPFHPSNGYTIEELNANLEDILHDTEEKCNAQLSEFDVKMDLLSKIQNGRFRVDQGVIGSCAGGLFENISKAADILKGKTVGSDGFQLSIYPASQPIMQQIVEKGIASTLISAGVGIKSAFCGPCFGAGDVPANNGFSIRHTTRNFSNREGSRPGGRQIASVGLMDALSIAATAANKGYLTPATDLSEIEYTNNAYYFNAKLYEDAILNCYKKGDMSVELVKGPNIKDIPAIPKLNENLLLKTTAVILDPVTTTDELIPNGESSSFRSNLPRLAEYTLSAKVPEYVGRCKIVRAWEEKLMAGQDVYSDEAELTTVRELLKAHGYDVNKDNTCIGSVLYANKPGDGSAREYAASNQKVLGGWANICREYATKRYRSNLINWGVLPFTYKGERIFETGSYIWVPDIKNQVEKGECVVTAYIIQGEELVKIELSLDFLGDKERQIISAGCLINYYRM